MPDLFTATVPQSARRRLILALRGWRYDRQTGGWSWHGLWHVSEEALDHMTDAAFEAFATQWQGAAVSAL